MIKFFNHIRRQLLNDNRFGKYIMYAIGEIALVVIGILIALQVNNWNNDRIIEHRVKAYSKSLLQDLANDIEMIRVSQYQAIKSYNKIDSLRQYVLSTAPEDLSSTDLFLLTNDIMYRPYKWNRSTFDEMKNSEVLQYFRNDSLKKKLIAYESFSYHLDEDFEFDKTNANRAEEIIAEILDLNTPYFSRLKALEDNRFSDSVRTSFETEEYTISRINDRKLMTYDEKEIKKLVNTFIQIQEAYKIRAFIEMHDLIENAKEINSLIKNENL